MSAIERTELCTIATMSAAACAGKLEYVVLRSGLEVYGPRTAAASVPDEDVMPEPRTPYGRSLLEVESVAAGLRLRYGVGVCALRYAPVVGPHVPSPVGRLLRLPIVPVPAFADPPFSLLHPDDAAVAMVKAIDKRYDGALNVVGPGAATPWQAVRLGGRVPLPVIGPMWEGVARAVEFAGAAVAPHVIELLRHGRTGAGSRADRRPRPALAAPHADGLARPLRVGRRDPHPHQPRAGRMSLSLSERRDTTVPPSRESEA